jgi:predicted choloylglycine hydrolase
LPEHLAECNAMSLQVGIDADETVLAQCFLDLTPMSACSTITLPAEAAPDHVARFGRNLDFPALNVADKHTVLFIYHPSDGRYAFAAVGWPGMAGVLSGMNEHGLALANMEVKRPARLPSAMPYTMLYRTVLEKCKTVDEAIDLLGKTPRQTPNNLMLMDAAGNRAVVEITPEAIAVRRGPQGAALMSTNHQRGEDCDTAGRCERYDFLHETSHTQFGHIDVKALEQMLAGASQANFTLQSMIFEPANRVIYLSAGHNAARGTFHRVDLAKYFQ